MEISLIKTALDLHENETFAQWRNRYAQKRIANAENLLKEIDKTLQENGILSWTAEGIIAWAKEKFQEEAEQSDAAYGSRYDDGSAEFTVATDYEDNELFLNLQGSGEASKSRGMRGSYDVPDDPDEYSYTVSSAILEIWTHDEEGNQLGEWDITALLSN